MHVPTFKGTNAEWLRSISWVVVVVLVLLPLADLGAWFNAILVAFAYLLGLISGSESARGGAASEEERMAMAKRVLSDLDEATIDAALAHLKKGQQVATAKEIRFQSHVGLREAKHAVDLLVAYGTDWRSADADG